MEREDYTAAAKTLHWLAAALIAALFALAWTMGGFSGLEKFRLYNLHKSLGLVMLGLMSLRLLSRLIRPAPPLPRSMAPAERLAAHFVHLALYITLFVMTLSGWAMISSSDKPSVFFNAAPFPLIPWLASLAPDEKKAFAKLFLSVHETAANVLLVLLAAHVAAAFRHAFILKDGMMSRMLPRFARAGKSAKSTNAALLLLGSLALGVGAPPARAADWSIDPRKSEIGFEATGAGYSTKGVFKTYKAEVEFDPDMPEQTSIRVALDMKSAATDSADADQTIHSADFFAPARYPSAVFVARGAKPDGDGRYVVEGRLTLKGVTKPVTLPFSVAIRDGVAAVRGETRINRLDFGVGPESVAGMAVDRDVKLTIALTATKLDN
jgi:cytochrome b561/polyisoprenoid-binding protein YceI